MFWFSGEGEKAWTEVTNSKRNQLWIQGRRKFRPAINTYKIICYERSIFSSNHKRSIYSDGCQISCSGIWLNLKGILFIICEFLSSIRNADHLRAFGDFDMKSSTPNRWYLQLLIDIKRLNFLRYLYTISPIHQFDEIEWQIGCEYHINLESLDIWTFCKIS